MALDGASKSCAEIVIPSDPNRLQFASASGRCSFLSQTDDARPEKVIDVMC